MVIIKEMKTKSLLENEESGLYKSDEDQIPSGTSKKMVSI